MNRRSLLAMIGLAPVAAVTSAAAFPRPDDVSKIVMRETPIIPINLDGFVGDEHAYPFHFSGGVAYLKSCTIVDSDNPDDTYGFPK